MTFLSGVYTITNVGTGTALHLDGHPVQGWEKLNGADRLKQLWFLKPTDASDSGNSDDAKWVALNIATNKCLDVDSSNSANGTEIIGYPYNKTDNQHWIIRHPSSSSYWRFQSVKTKTFIDLEKGQSANGTRVQGWEGTWSDGSHNRGWVLNQKSLTGRQIQAVLDKNGKLKGKVIVEYPDRIYFAPDQALFESIWAKSGLADAKPRPPLFDGTSYEKGGYVVSYANEAIKVDGFDILSGTVSCVQDATQEISSLSLSLTNSDESGRFLDKAVFFDPQTGSTYDDVPKGVTVRSIVL
ncbi:ricin B lectin domain-containing protein [Schizophyllum commune]